METVRDAGVVTIRESDLFEAFLVALESGEFVQIRDQLWDDGNGACAWGVGLTIARRAGLEAVSESLHPQFVAITRRAGAILGYDGMVEANDAGVPFARIAAALRQARAEVEGAG